MLTVGELGLGEHVSPLDQDPTRSLRPIRRIRLGAWEIVSLGPYHNGPSPEFGTVVERMAS